MKVCKRDTSKGNASSCWCWRILWDKKSLLFWVGFSLLDSNVHHGDLCDVNKFIFSFTRYIIHRLLLCALGRRAEDDRDHYGNKRLDLAGPLLGGLFRMVYYVFVFLAFMFVCLLFLFLFSAMVHATWNELLLLLFAYSPLVVYMTCSCSEN